MNMQAELISVSIYWGGIEGKYPAEKSDTFYGSWSGAEKFATGIARVNSGSLDRVERSPGLHRYHGTTPFGPFEAVVRRLA
jgi:hypothetical protein